MKDIPLKQAGPFFLALTALLLILAQPLWAVEDNPTPQGQQEESFFESIKRKTQEWWNGDNKTEKIQPETSGQTEEKPQAPATKGSEQKSDGRKAIDTVKKEMNKISDNVSESVERDKKHLKKKLEKLLDKK